LLAALGFSCEFRKPWTAKAQLMGNCFFDTAKIC
jgi:hypothetical protein